MCKNDFCIEKWKLEKLNLFFPGKKVKWKKPNFFLQSSLWKSRKKVQLWSWNSYGKYIQYGGRDERFSKHWETYYNNCSFQYSNACSTVRDHKFPTTYHLYLLVLTSYGSLYEHMYRRYCTRTCTIYERISQIQKGLRFSRLKEGCTLRNCIKK